jgi:hypothetical protein
VFHGLSSDRKLVLDELEGTALIKDADAQAYLKKILSMVHVELCTLYWGD